MNTRPEFTVNLDVDQELLNEVEDGLDYLRARLIGPIPAVFQDLATELTRVLLERHSRAGIPFRLDLPPSEPPTAEEARREEEDIREFDEWRESDEGQAEEDRAEKLYQFRAEREEETRALRAEWLEARAHQFARERREWERARRAALEQQFNASKAVK